MVDPTTGPDATSRRGFLAQVGAASLLTAAACATAQPGAAGASPAPAPTPTGNRKFDDSWTRRINKPYRAVFDFPDIKDPTPVGKLEAVMDAHHEALGLTDADLSFVLIIRHFATPAA